MHSAAIGQTTRPSFARPRCGTNCPWFRTNQVTLRGTLFSTNGLPALVTVYWGTYDGGTVAPNWQAATSLGAATAGLLTTDISGLLPNTRYYYRFYGTNGAGAAWASASTTFTTTTPPAYGDITFFVGSDLHYGYTGHVPTSDEISRAGLDVMNALPGQAYPASIGGGVVALPRGALLIGDLTETGTNPQWCCFTNDWGLNGEQRFSFPVYEGYGNHDLAWGFPLEGIKARNPFRCGVKNVSSNGYHYSWDWDFLHLVCLNLFPGNEVDPGFPATSPNSSLEFLVSDLATNVGVSGRPVVLYHHYGFDAPGQTGWSARQQTNYYEAIKNYNVIAIFAGHSHQSGFTNWCGIDTCVDGAIGKYGNFFVAHVTWTNLTLVERLPNNTWRNSFAKRILVPPKLAVSNATGATEVTLCSARLNGQIAIAGSPPVEVSLYWGLADGGTNETVWANVVHLGARGLDAFSTVVTGLSEGTTYYYRCYASKAASQAWSPTSARFRTLPDFSAWGAGMKITFTGYTGREPLTNFPALVVFNTNRPGFTYDQFASAVGNDLRCSDENGVELNYEIDEWNTNGSSYVWVQVPQLSGTNTAIWAYWKNPAAAADPPPYATNGATWSEDYAGVWHMKRADTLNSANGTAGVSCGNATIDGLIGGAQSFSRATNQQYIEVGDLDVTNFTAEAWTRSAYHSELGDRRVMEKPGSFKWEQRNVASNLDFEIINVPTDYCYEQGGCYDLGDSAWTYQAITYGAATSEARGYINAALQYTQGKGAGLAPAQSDNPVTISSASLGYYGRLDEVRLSRVVRSADWLGACYASVTNHESFTGYGAARPNTPPALSPVADQVVDAGETLTVANVATDPDLPAQLLTFSLLTAPRGASLETTSGIFLWCPTIADINSTNLVTLKVTDDGRPARNATQSFAVVVHPPTRPLLVGRGSTNGGWIMDVWGRFGMAYAIEASTNLLDWTTLYTTNMPALTFAWADTNNGNFRSRFYRVRLNP